MPTIADIRQKYPEYNDMSDRDLADALHKKFYADVPRAEFEKKIGLFSAEKARPETPEIGFFDPITKPLHAAATTASNVPGSAVEFGKNVITPVIHPVETAKSFYDLGHGILQKLGVAKGTDDTKYVDALAKFFKDRYGSVDAVKNTMQTDPVGFLADVSSIFSGGGTAAARVPGMVGKIGEVAKTAGQVADPMRAVGATAKGVGAVGSELVGALGTHTGGEPLRIAYEAGLKGGPASKAFLDNLRGKAPSEEAVKAAKQAVYNMVEERGSAYRTEMSKLGLNNTVLPFDKIDDALIDATKVNTYKGVDLSPTTQEVRRQMAQAIQDWRMLPPKEFHTAEGLDALKRKLGDIRDATEINTPERKVAGDIYRAVRQTIVDEAPEYKKIMGAYEEASDLVRQMEKTLSLNPKASIDTSLRKLQSVLRNNVNASYGHRRELAEFLVKAGAPHLMERLAGQALQPWLPRGLGRLGAQIGWELGLIEHAPVAKMAVGAAPFLSPRVMGETAHAVGRASPAVKQAGKLGVPAFQLGRTSGVLEQPSLLESANPGIVQ